MEQTLMSNNSEGQAVADSLMLTDKEKDALGEIGNICMGTSATTLSQLLGKRVTITTPRVSLVKGNEYLDEYEKPIVATEVSYTKGLNGFNIFLIKKSDALSITEVLMGSAAGADEMYISAISEVMNQMVGSSSTALADLLRLSVNISPPVVKEIINNNDVVSKEGQMLIRTSFLLDIEGLLKSDILQIVPYDFGKKLASTLIGEQPESKPGELETLSNIAGVSNPTLNMRQQSATAASVTKDVKIMNNENKEEKIELKEVKFQSFNEKPGDFTFPTDLSNIDLIIDVPLHVTVVLGKSKRSIKEILELNRGSIIVLDRLAGEMVDVLVNGKLFARGEVVVIEDNYGVRITEITSIEHSKDK
ncbi:MAG: flagellar motor switch phosphatase FliY [Christensenellales bacterium]